MVCSAVDIKHCLMFIHVHFGLYVNMKRRLVHVFELRQNSDLSRHIKEPQNGNVLISLKMTKCES